MLSVKQYKTIKKYIKLNKGATLSSNYEILNLSSGYFVSLYGYELKQKKLSYLTLIKYSKLAKSNHALIGLWIDNGYIYYDISQHIENKYLAFREAIANKQKAYFDIFNNCSIYL